MATCMVLALGMDSPFPGILISPFVRLFVYSATSLAMCQALLKNRIKTDVPSFFLLSFLGHRHWVLSISWSPDGKKLASGCKNGQVDGGQGNLVGTLGFSSWELGQNLQGGRGGQGQVGGGYLVSFCL